MMDACLGSILDLGDALLSVEEQEESRAKSCGYDTPL